MGGKSKAPPPPDYSGIANASKESAELAYQSSKEQLAWAKEQYAKDSEVTNKVVDAGLKTQAINDETAAKDRARYESTFQPLEDKLAKEAADYATPERKDLEMGRAQANVAQQFEGARQASQRSLEGFGINPNATRFAALDIGVRAQQAASQAAAGNQASENVDATGRALRSEAINVGKGYPGQIAGQYGTALAAGNQAVGSQLNQTASGANTMGTGIGWNSQGNQALGVWGNALSQGYSAQMSQFNANQNSSSGAGSALGLIGGMALKGFMGSDERIKENIEPVGQTYDGQTVYRYNYKGDDTPQIGLIAQEVEKKHPEAVAENAQGVKMVNYDAATDGAAGHGGGALPMGMSPSHGQKTDDIQARVKQGGGAVQLDAGEFIIPRSATKYYGEKFFHNLIDKAEKARKPQPDRASAIPSR